MNGSPSLRNRISATVRDIPRSGIRDFFDIVTTMKDVISLGIGEPDFDTPWHVRESTVFALERGATHYTSNLGYLELRRVLAGYVRKTFGADYNTEDEVLVTVGVSEALDLALRALLNPGDEVLYHEPCYVSYRATILFAHGVPVVVETRAEDGFRLTRAMLEARVTPRTKVLMLNFPNNPTGYSITKDEADQIVGVLREAADAGRNLVVVTDDAYFGLFYGDDLAKESLFARLAACHERLLAIKVDGPTKEEFVWGLRCGMLTFSVLATAFLAYLGIIYSPDNKLWLDLVLFGVIGFFVYPTILLLVVSALDFTSKKAVGTAAGLIGLFGYLGRVVEGKGIGVLAERYGWDTALFAVLAATFMAIVLLSLSWKLSPRDAKAIQSRNS